MEVEGSSRQYGGYGGGYGGFIECCQGVVDPLLLLSIIAALAGLTYWLRLQVVTFITGKKRRSFDHLQATHLLGNFADHQPTNLLESFLVDSLASGSLLNQLNLLEDELPSPGCTPRLAVCLSKTLASQLAVEEEETGLGSELVESLAEWASSGSVEKTWRSKLGKRPLSSNVVHCFSKYNTCLL